MCDTIQYNTTHNMYVSENEALDSVLIKQMLISSIRETNGETAMEWSGVECQWNGVYTNTHVNKK